MNHVFHCMKSLGLVFDLDHKVSTTLDMDQRTGTDRTILTLSKVAASFRAINCQYARSFVTVK